jgi:hypothetical protein
MSRLALRFAGAECRVERAVDQRGDTPVDPLAARLRHQPGSLERARVAGDRILGDVAAMLFLRHHLERVVTLRVAAHSADQRFDERRPPAFARPGESASVGGGHRVRVVAVDGHRGDAVAGSAVGELLGGELHVGRRGEGVAVVLDHQDERQLPDRRHVEPFVEVAGRGAALADEGDRHAVAAGEPAGQGAPGGHRDHRPEVADHPDVVDAVLGGEPAVVERTLDALREAVRLAEQLTGEAVEHAVGIGPPAVRLAEAQLGEGPRRIEVAGEDRPEIAVQRTEHVARLERETRRHGDPFVSDLRIPLRDPPGEQERFEARVEVTRQLHEGVTEDAVARDEVHGGGGTIIRRPTARRRPAGALSRRGATARCALRTRRGAAGGGRGRGAP